MTFFRSSLDAYLMVMRPPFTDTRRPKALGWVFSLRSLMIVCRLADSMCLNADT